MEDKDIIEQMKRIQLGMSANLNESNKNEFNRNIEFSGGEGVNIVLEIRYLYLHRHKDTLEQQDLQGLVQQGQRVHRVQLVHRVQVLYCHLVMVF